MNAKSSINSFPSAPQTSDRVLSASHSTIRKSFKILILLIKKTPQFQGQIFNFWMFETKICETFIWNSGFSKFGDGPNVKSLNFVEKTETIQV